MGVASDERALQPHHRKCVDCRNDPVCPAFCGCECHQRDESYTRAWVEGIDDRLDMAKGPTNE